MIPELEQFLKEAGEREAKATKGPWTVPHVSRDDLKCNCGYVWSNATEGLVADLAVRTPSEDELPLEECATNGLFIAHARTDLPTALRVIAVLLEYGDFPKLYTVQGVWPPGEEFLTALRAALSGGGK